MRDGYGRLIDYLRISVTDRCNFRCSYCLPPEGIGSLPDSEILSYAELLRVITILGRQGVSKVRITGGEPLVRDGLTDFISSIRATGLVSDLAMTTNGSLLGGMARQLKAAGLNRVNISVDTVDPQRFAAITGGGELAETLAAVEAALEAGLAPVKLNVVITEACGEEDVLYFVSLVKEHPIAVRFIECMPVGQSDVRPGFSAATIKKVISKTGHGSLQPVKTMRGNGPAQYFGLPGTPGVFGFISPISDPFCQGCSRIRLTADGKIKPCLLSDQEFDIRTALRRGASDRTISELFSEAIRRKPDRHYVSASHRAQLGRGMSQIGG
ncbi:MAG: GTP 3',8-cyclase MoaA [Negativicutes bacterium]|nr:GTP 3',8-cyclase MoaA [Negativicutes bacterium]